MKKIFTLFLLLILFHFTHFAFPFVWLPSESSSEHRIILKMKEEIPQSKLEEDISHSIKSEFHFTSSRKINSNQSKSLQNIYLYTFSNNVDANLIIHKIQKLNYTIWAEVDEKMRLADFVPSDSLFSAQWYLSKTNLPAAWEIQTADSSIIVAVLDNGIDQNHSELQNILWRNFQEVVDGIDNDENGLVDDVAGWDFGENNADINHDFGGYHGSMVAGIIAANTNNLIGISSVAFNSKIMPLKITSVDDEEGEIVWMSSGYEAIIYAAESGADIINCSWGNYQYSNFGAEAVDFANQNGCVVVAAAGNDGIPEIFYPAGLNGVLSVGGTNEDDEKWSESNYGTNLDVLSPSTNILTLSANNSYGNASGTSLATSIVSGIAALVKSHFPDDNSFQIAERIRITSENIDNLNSGFEYQLGKGRVNSLAAINSDNSKSVRILTYLLQDDNSDGILENGEQVSIEMNFINHLAQTNSLQIYLISENSNVQILNGNYSAGSVQRNSVFSNSSNKFVIQIDEYTPENEQIDIRIQFVDENYTDFQWISFTANPSYSDMNLNNVALTLTGNGTLGYEDYPYNSKGNGLTYKNDEKTRFFEAGLMFGNSAVKISDAIHKTMFEYHNDFENLTPFSIELPGENAEQQGFANFLESVIDSNYLGIQTTLNSYSFSDVENEDFVVLHYNFKNISGRIINDFYAGLFIDFDLDENDYDDDKVEYDENANVGFAFDANLASIQTYHGVSLISDMNYNFYAIENYGNDISVEDFSDAEKWLTLSNGLQKITAGPSDISLVVAGGPYQIADSNSLNVAFAIAVGDSKENVLQSIRQAKRKYSEFNVGTEILPEIPKEYKLFQNYPNPFNPSTEIKFKLPTNGNVKLTVFNSLAEEVITLANKEFSAGSHSIVFHPENLPSGIYFYKLTSGNFVDVKKMILLK